MVDLNINIPDDFLKEEVRDGFLVSEKMKEVWAVELDLLARFIDVCKKYGLKYYALGGTLLGAVRHKGFIPWDDDVDVLMPREDYNKLISIGNEFEYPYFLSSPLTENKFWRSHLQLRNSNTTGTTSSDKYRNNNKGIFIDIFPLDLVSNSFEQRNEQRKLLKKTFYWADKYDIAALCWEEDKDVKSLIKKAILSLFINPTKYFRQTFIKYNEILSMYSNNQNGMLAHASLSYKERGVWPKEWYSSSKIMDFEFLKISVPCEYDKVLAKYFGDDYLIIPSEYPSATHGKPFFDTDNSFKKYFK